MEPISILIGIVCLIVGAAGAYFIANSAHTKRVRKLCLKLRKKFCK